MISSLEAINDSLNQDEVIAMQYIKTSVMSNMFSVYLQNGSYEMALDAAGDYHSILSYSTDTSGKFFYKKSVYNVGIEKVEQAQYFYLTNLYNLAIRIKDTALRMYTSERIATNARASVYNQIVALSYLFKANSKTIQQGEFGNMRYREVNNYASSLLEKYNNLSIANQKRLLGNDNYLRKQFGFDYYRFSEFLLTKHDEVFDSSKVFSFGRNKTYSQLIGFSEGLELLHFMQYEKFASDKFFELAKRSHDSNFLMYLKDLVLLANDSKALKLDCDKVKTMIGYCDLLYLTKEKENYKKQSYRICR